MSDKQDGDWDFVISSYSLGQAIDDGVLIPFFEPIWPFMTEGRPIVVTRVVYDTYTDDQLIDVLVEYVDWKRDVKPTLPEEDQMFVSESLGETLWVIEDSTALTILRPEDY